MICYTLICSNNHKFDSWFANADAFESLKKNNHLSCAVCGNTEIRKAIMAPNVNSTKKDKIDKKEKINKNPLSTKKSLAETALSEIKKKFEKISENVGSDFAKEARAINDGISPERTIHGKATMEEAKSLNEDGIKVFPLPWVDRKTN
tara:strand:- start:63 stop:506 length:444 start_codon:yes stop_codon:yes gene_type:complete